MNTRDLIRILDEMKSNRVANYVIAGLDSYLITEGKVRMFVNSRDHQDAITPHSHRFDFVCLVLNGTVQNKIWKRVKNADEGDLFQESTLDYSGEIGKHAIIPGDQNYWVHSKYTYHAGSTYKMEHDQIHSIEFSKNAIVLFFEGPAKTNTSKIIEPVVDGRVIPTYQKQDYMFLEETQ